MEDKRDIPQAKRLGLAQLAAIVFGAVVGIGIFNIAQNMAVGAQVGAVILSWVITGVGILFLVFTFKTLADARPDLNAGIYQYAQQGFGDYVGFNIAWGYWLCTAFGNVAYAVMLNDAFGAFWPRLHDHGWPTVVVGSGLIWTMFFVVSRGVRTASLLNLLITIIKIATIVLIGVILAIFFRAGLFSSDFWGHASPELGSVEEQVRSTMMVTLWCFIGIEGAVVMSARAKRPRDVGRASVLGFALAWALYVLVSVLCYGVMSQPEMAELPNPSLAYILIKLCGEWAYYFVIIAVIVSLLGGWVAWTLICAQVPSEAAQVGVFPRIFLRRNHEGVPIYGLFISAIVMQIFIALVVTAQHVYMAALEMTGMMVLPAYFFSGLFLLKASLRPQKYLVGINRGRLWRYRAVAVVCVAFCCWLIYSGGLLLLMSTSLFYIPGLYFYIKARQGHYPNEPRLSVSDQCILAGLILCAIMSVILLIGGKIVL
ncbi:MAG: basic amino acid/polyamine antiporter [Bacteroidales bacterium]|nr:basic amino acid/polyamine antiporter [Bacteroidales bacterium]